MDPPTGLIYQSELPFERDAIQCVDGKWRYVRLRMRPVDVVAEADEKNAVWKAARLLSDRPVWEEHYEGMKLVDCVPPKEVFRHPETCFLVTDGSPRPDMKPADHPESHTRLRRKEESAPDTPKSASWTEGQRTEWRKRILHLSRKLRGL